MHLPKHLLLTAALLTSLPVTSTLVEAGPHVSYAVTVLETSKNPVNHKVMQLIAKEKYKELEAMIAGGMNLNAGDDKHVRPIHYAAYMGNLKAMRMFIQKNADLSAVVQGGWNVLHYAAFGGHVGMANLLVAMGVPVNSIDVGGETPLFYAIEAGSLPMVRWLIDNGADVNHVNNNKETPLSFALADKNQGIIAVLEQRGAKKGTDYQAERHDGDAETGHNRQ